MPDLTITVEDASPILFAAVPTMAFKLAITNAIPDERIQNIVLRCQLQLEVTRRQYSTTEEEKLRDLFGERSRWGTTLKPMLWTHATAIVGPFTDATSVDLSVPCTFDFSVGATKYFHGLESGDLPIAFLHSGSVFYEDIEGRLQVAPISWNSESRYRLPVAAWHALASHYYPNSAWLNLPRDTFDRLYDFKVREGIPTWDGVFDRLLPEVARTTGGA